jgi:hypothetical protein
VVADLIAIRTDEQIDAVAATVGEALGVSLTPHASGHWGDPYYSGWPENEIKLTANLDPMYQEGDPPDERWFSPSARDAAYLVWDAADAPAAAAKLQAARLIAEVVTD